MRLISLLALVAVLLSSCGRRDAARQGDGDTLFLQHAKLLTIVRHQGYTVAEVANPWHEGKLLQRYVLVPQGAAMPADLPDGTVIRTPVSRAAVFTTVHCALLTELGHGHNIVGVADLKYIKVPYVQAQVRAGRIADCGGGLNPVVEKVMDIKPDIIMLSPFENSGGYGKVEELGIPIVECAEYMERSPLARAEWIRFYGMLFGAQQRADSLFHVVDSSYNALCRKARQAGPGASVLIDRIVGSVWYVPGGQSTIGQMLQDAGGRYPWAADDHSGSLSLPFETVLERAGDCDVWLYRYSGNHDQTYAELLADYHGYAQLAAFRHRRVYGCNVEQSLFYEESPFRPDLLLSEFIHILHPDIPNLPPLRYYKKLKEE